MYLHRIYEKVGDHDMDSTQVLVMNDLALFQRNSRNMCLHTSFEASCIYIQALKHLVQLKFLVTNNACHIFEAMKPYACFTVNKQGR